MTKTGVQDIDPQGAQLMIAQGRATLIDVREGWELAQSRIKGAQWNPTSSFDPAKVIVDAGTVALFYCAAGVRSRRAGEAYVALKGGMAYNLAGGITAWEGANLPLEMGATNGLAPQRKLALIGGIGTITFLALGIFAHPGFLGGVALLAGAQLLHGITGICIGSIILGKLGR